MSSCLQKLHFVLNFDLSGLQIGSPAPFGVLLIVCALRYHVFLVCVCVCVFV